MPTKPLGREDALSFRGPLRLLLLSLVGVAVWYLKPPAPRPITKMLVEVEPAEWLGSAPPRGSGDFRLSRTAMALSPDGAHVVFSAGDSEGSRLYLRPMDALEAEPISGTEGAVGPFVSPDGEWIGYWADGDTEEDSHRRRPADHAV